MLRAIQRCQLEAPMYSSAHILRASYRHPPPALVAKYYLEQFWDKKLPVDAAAIARAVGVHVLSNSHMGEYIGWFHNDAGVPTIEINSHEPIVRQRFAVAHELAHYCLRHGPRQRDSVFAFSLANRDPFAINANKFASELLMPADIVNGLINRRNMTDINQMMSLFNTSGCAMEHRLKTLGWL